jgi:hypothetical protein
MSEMNSEELHDAMYYVILSLQSKRSVLRTFKYFHPELAKAGDLIDDEIDDLMHLVQVMDTLIGEE